MSIRQESRRRGHGRNRSSSAQLRQVIHAIVEKLEDRRLLAGDVRLVGITGNFQSGDPGFGNDETLYDIKYATAGSTDPIFLDGWEDITQNQPDTKLSISDSIGVTDGHGALRVDVDNGVGAYWGIRSPNVVELLRDGASAFSYDMTLLNKELNGGAFGGNGDNSFNGYAQNNALAISIATSTGEFIQRDFTSGNANDSLNKDATWAGLDGMRTITWDLTKFTASNGQTLQEFLTASGARDARFWIVTQGQDDNGHVGPMRFYFDNFRVFTASGSTVIGDFEPLQISKIIQLPHVPDTDSIGFNPDTGLLHRVSGANSYRNDPNRIAYRDNQFMETINMNDPVGSQVGVFNANYEGGPVFDPPDGTFMNYGLPAPFPTFVFPDHRRTDDETDPTFRAAGPDEFKSMRDLTWSSSEHLFYATDDSGGLFRLTADGQSNFVDHPAAVNGAKGITFYTSGGVRRLLLSEKSGPNLWTIDPATGQPVGDPIVMTDQSGTPYPGVLSLVEDPTSNTLLGIVKLVDVDDPLEQLRELVRIDPNNTFIDPNTGQATTQTTSLGVIGTYMADLAFIVSEPSVTSSQFLYEDAPQRLVFSFSQNVGNSLTKDDLKIDNLGPGGGPVTVGDPQYDYINNTVTFPLSGLTDGNYRATLKSAGVTNTLEMPITANEEVNFFWLNGDLNRDRSVTISDFIDLASHFGSAANKWSDGDLNYDGVVSISDFIDLASNFNKTVPPPAQAPQTAADATVTSTSAASADSGDDVLDVKESATLSSHKSSRRRIHHRHQGHKAAQHLIGRSGTY